ncbi:hypothetical protein [Cyanobium sp. WAJ14-Wanaka]|uniref:hypothetical protein n=1 Tax=Cyanobium sp. WAJ14-Wanaka TaxID=2823725 RepID=UPI0020CE2D09|nr:hypothetical protein [Cyanobium sp. WAJ14-Wanaka]MCP9776218.1 hypothetical protein [Cyanobium sp. WAJ14-Wanaka]
MAGASVTSARKAMALRWLQDGYSTTAIVTKLADAQGISRRQARRIVATAHAEVVADLTDVSAADVLAGIIHRLDESARVAMERHHPAAAVGALRLLAELVVIPNRNQHQQPYGKRWR